MTRILGVLALLLVLLAGVVASDRPGAPAALVAIETVDMNTLDPQRMSHNQDMRVGYALFEGLVRWDVLSEDMRVLPGAARRWEISDDGLTYTFFLHEGGRWSNGDPVRASDFVYAWKRGIMPDSASDYVKLFQLIDGASEFFAFRTEELRAYAGRPAEERTPEAALALRARCDEAFGAMVGLSTPDELTLRVRLERPAPYFLSLCAFATFLPVHPPTVEGWTSVDAATGVIEQKHGWTKPPHLVSNGPFVLERWRFKRELRLGRNPMYAGPFPARSESLSIVVIEDQNTSVLAFESGAADIHMDLEAEYIGDLLAQVERGERDDIHRLETFGTYFWNFNCTPSVGGANANPFADARVRRAFALALDKRSLVNDVRRSRERVARTLIPPNSLAGYRSPEGLGHDAARARAELASAGWTDRDGDGVPENERGERFPVVELLCTPVGGHADLALAMASMWERTLGVRSKLAIKETKVFRNTLDNRGYMMSRGGWYGDYLDPLTFLDLHRERDGNNDRGYADAAYEAMLDRANTEPDPLRRLDMLAEAERYTVEETMPVLPLYHYDQYYMYRPALRRDGTPNPGGVRGVSKHPRLVQYYFLFEKVPGDASEPAS
ncbi:MAG: peptide ABC transporter substrate-binding protein [Planctomycetota bacterium]|nr:peptide ABC transporter substrate-binding protein [Planctomycetota bacterium]